MAMNIRHILLDGERVTLECKKATKGVPNSLWDTYSAFANTKGRCKAAARECQKSG